MSTSIVFNLLQLRPQVSTEKRTARHQRMPKPRDSGPQVLWLHLCDSALAYSAKGQIGSTRYSCTVSGLANTLPRFHGDDPPPLELPPRSVEWGSTSQEVPCTSAHPAIELLARRARFQIDDREEDRGIGRDCRSVRGRTLPCRYCGSAGLVERILL